MMPGANYFLSQVASRTPGPFLGASVPPKDPSPPPYYDYFSTPKIEPYVSVIGTKKNTFQDVAAASPQPVPVHPLRTYSNGSPKPRYNLTYSPTPPPISPPAQNSSTKLPQPSKPLYPPGGKHNAPGAGTAIMPNPRKLDNPVGELQEMCTKFRWVFPTYYIYCDESQPHERAFSVVVRLYGIREKGEAKSKRAAKREAATRVLNRVKNWPAGVPFQQYTSLSPPVGVEKSRFKASHVIPPPSYYINGLNMLSQKYRFRVVYGTVDKRTPTGEIGFMVHLLTQPRVVLKGSGRTVFVAKAETAKGTFECLRLMRFMYFTQQPWIV